MFSASNQENYTLQFSHFHTQNRKNKKKNLISLPSTANFLTAKEMQRKIFI